MIRKCLNKEKTDAPILAPRRSESADFQNMAQSSRLPNCHTKIIRETEGAERVKKSAVSRRGLFILAQSLRVQTHLSSESADSPDKSHLQGE